MSCNKQQSTNRIATITISPHDNGRVVGQLTRLLGSRDTITAIADHGYKFSGWYDEQDNILTSDNMIVIDAWEDRTITPKFDPITITVDEFDAKDAMETYVYYLEKHGSGLNKTYQSAGAQSTDSRGTGKRLLTTGVEQYMFPVTYGYNYGPTEWDGDGNPTANDIGAATFNKSTGEKVGSYHRVPQTTDPDEVVISVPELLKVPMNSSPFPTAETHRGWAHTTDPGNTTSGWNNALYKAYTSPKDNSETLQFPLLQWHCQTWVWNYYTNDITRLAGLEDLNVHAYRCQNTYTGKIHDDTDTIAYWKNLRMLTSYWYSRPPADSTTLGGSADGPRLYEPYTHLYNMVDTSWHNGYGYTGAGDASNVNLNMTWKTPYRTKPLCGSMLSPLRYIPLRNLSVAYQTNFANTDLFKTYYRSLNSLIMNHTDTMGQQEYLFDYNTTITLPSLRTMYLYECCYYGDGGYIKNFDFIKNSDLDYFYNYHTKDKFSKIRTLTPFKNKKITVFYNTGSNTYGGLRHDPLYDERVKLHMNFDSQQILTQDSTRYANKLNTYGITVTDTK